MPAPGPPRRRRRGRRAGEGGGTPAPGRRRGRPDAEAAAPAEPVVEPSRIDASRPADDPLTPDEVAEMDVHLAFLRQHRKALRLKVNAAEDLLLAGSRPPAHRGACLHLLSKVDLGCVQGALARLDDKEARTRLLAGVVRFSTDVGILLLYLESLVASASRAQAAAAFGGAVRRLDFAGLSAARMRRVLDLIAATFEGHERVQVLFGLLQSASFRAAFDAVAPGLPEPLAELFLPLCAVHETCFEGLADRHGADVLARGVGMLLAAPDAALRALPQDVRERLLESAVRLVREPEVADRAERVLLESLPPPSRAFSHGAMLRAADLLRRGDDEEAGRLLARVAENHAGFELPRRWLAALAAPRLGRLALTGGPGRDGRRGESETAVSDLDELRRVAPEVAGRLVAGTWLDGQRPALARAVAADEAAALAAETALQQEACLPGVLPVLGLVTGPPLPHVLMSRFGAPARAVLAAPPSRAPARLPLILSLAQLLHGLALAGIALPDADLDRFLVAGSGREGRDARFLLADWHGARHLPAAEATAAMRAVALSACEALAAGAALADVPREVRDVLAWGPELPALIEAIAAWA